MNVFNKNFIAGLLIGFIITEVTYAEYCINPMHEAYKLFVDYCPDTNEIAECRSSAVISKRDAFGKPTHVFPCSHHHVCQVYRRAEEICIEIKP